jgi:hypothetical protein
MGFIADLPSLVVDEGDDGDREFAAAALGITDAEGAGIGEVLGGFLAPEFDGETGTLVPLASEDGILGDAGRVVQEGKPNKGRNPAPEWKAQVETHGLRVMRGVSPRRPEMMRPPGLEPRTEPQPQGESLLNRKRRGRNRCQANAAAVRATTARAAGVCQFIGKVQNQDLVVRSLSMAGGNGARNGLGIATANKVYNSRLSPSNGGGYYALPAAEDGGPTLRVILDPVIMSGSGVVRPEMEKRSTAGSSLLVCWLEWRIGDCFGLGSTGHGWGQPHEWSGVWSGVPCLRWGTPVLFPVL